MRPLGNVPAGVFVRPCTTLHGLARPCTTLHDLVRLSVQHQTDIDGHSWKSRRHQIGQADIRCQAHRLRYHPVVRVILTDTEVRICRWLAAQRFAAARKAGVLDAQMGPQSSEQTDLDGIAGEFAFCKVANVWPDMTIGARRGGHDAFLDGMSVDVKTTRCPTGHLLATIKKSTTASDVYVLVIGTVPEFRIAGWASAAQLLHPENIADFGHGSSYALSQRQLQPISTLVDSIRHTSRDV